MMESKPRPGCVIGACSHDALFDVRPRGQNDVLLPKRSLTSGRESARVNAWPRVEVSNDYKRLRRRGTALQRSARRHAGRMMSGRDR